MSTIEETNEAILSKFERSVRAAFPDTPWSIDPHGNIVGGLEFVWLRLRPAGTDVQPALAMEAKAILGSDEEELSQELRANYSRFMAKHAA